MRCFNAIQGEGVWWRAVGIHPHHGCNLPLTRVTNYPLHFVAARGTDLELDHILDEVARTPHHVVVTGRSEPINRAGHRHR